MLGKARGRVKPLAKALVLSAVVAASVLALARPPLDDAARRARITELYAESRARFPQVEEVAPEEVLAHPGDFLLVDVRRADERQVSRLPSAVDRRAWEADPSLAAGRKVVAYCTIGHRSGIFAREQAEKGRKVANLAGGILAWAHAGGEMVHEGRAVRRAHVYGPRWNLLPRGWTARW